MFTTMGRRPFWPWPVALHIRIGAMTSANGEPYRPTGGMPPARDPPGKWIQAPNEVRKSTRAGYSIEFRLDPRSSRCDPGERKTSCRCGQVAERRITTVAYRRCAGSLHNPHSRNKWEAAIRKLGNTLILARHPAVRRGWLAYRDTAARPRGEERTLRASTQHHLREANLRGRRDRTAVVVMPGSGRAEKPLIFQISAS
jgi:hypothetical protein